DDARLDDDRRRIHDTADHSREIDASAYDAAGIDGGQLRTVPLAPVPVEVPPGNPVLRANHGCLRCDERQQPRGHISQAMGFESKQYYINRPNVGWIIGGSGLYLKLSNRAAHAYALLLHRLQMGSTGDERDVLAGSRKHRSSESSYCTRT